MRSGSAASEGPARDQSSTLRRSYLKDIIAERCVLTDADAWLVSTRGGDYSWLIDMRQAFLFSEALSAICDEFWMRYEPLLPFQVGGLEISAIPLVVAITMDAHKRGLSVNGFILRKERKPSGVGKVIEGRINDEPIVIVDDIFNSSNSLEKVRVTLEDVGRTIDRVFTVVDYQSPSGSVWKAKHGLSVDAIFDLSEFGLKDARPALPRGLDLDVVWRFTSPSANHFDVVPKSAPAVSKSRVVIGSDRGTLWVREVRTGALCWQFQTSHPGRKGIWSRPVVVDDRVFFGAYDGNLYCLALNDGREMWRASAGDWIGSSPAVSPDLGLLWIGLEHEVPGRHGSVAAYNLFTGEKVWEHYVEEYVHGSPIYCGALDSVFIGGNDHNLYCFRAVTGKLVWSFATGGPIKDAPAFDQTRGLVYVAGFDGFIRAIDALSGEQVWAFATPDSLYATPLVVGDRLFIAGNDKRLHIIDLVQHSHKHIDLGSKSTCSPVLIGGRVMFGANNGRLYEVDPETGELTGMKMFSEPITSRLACCADTGLILLVTYMNELVCLRQSAA